jgi:hypothetical protein
MSVTVEQFARSLIKTLMPRPGQAAGYLLVQNFCAAVQQALVPPGEQGRPMEYPLLYKGPWDAEKMLIVNNADEQREAVAQGWNVTPAPRPQGYPQNWVEVDPSRGSDYRRVRISNPKDEQTFKTVVDLSNWTRDDAYALAGRPIGLDDLVAEHKEKLKRKVDEGMLRPPENADAQSTSEE